MSALTSRPPCAGATSYTAYSMPGNRVSTPKIGRPATILALSMPTSGLPMMVNCPGCLSGTLSRSGGASVAATEATLP